MSGCVMLCNEWSLYAQISRFHAEGCRRARRTGLASGSANQRVPAHLEINYLSL